MKTPAKRVLVVDDETMIRHNVGDLLRAYGFAVTEAQDGADVSRMAATENPDVIVMDVSMPRMDGFTAFRELREDPATGHIPVVFLSNRNDYELGANHDCDSIAQNMGVRAPEAFLDKPFEGRHLIREVFAACGS